MRLKYNSCSTYARKIHLLNIKQVDFVIDIQITCFCLSRKDTNSLMISLRSNKILNATVRFSKESNWCICRRRKSVLFNFNKKIIKKSNRTLNWCAEEMVEHMSGVSLLNSIEVAKYKKHLIQCKRHLFFLMYLKVTVAHIRQVSYKV